MGRESKEEARKRRVENLLKKIEDVGDSSDASGAIQKLFKQFDEDSSGTLEEVEFQKMLTQLAKYFYDKAEKNDKGKHDEETIKKWLQQWLDPNQGGKCSKEELE